MNNTTNNTNQPADLDCLLSVLIANTLNPTPLKSLLDIVQDFINEFSASDDDYICDAFQGYADNRTSIYYSDIIKFISENVEAVNDAIAEFGWDGCGSDLYKAGQMAEYLQLEQMLNNDIEDIKKHLAINYISNIENGDDSNAIRLAPSDDVQSIIADFIDTLEVIDTSDRLEAIAEAVNEMREALHISAKEATQCH